MESTWANVKILILLSYIQIQDRMNFDIKIMRVTQNKYRLKHKRYLITFLAIIYLVFISPNAKKRNV